MIAPFFFRSLLSLILLINISLCLVATPEFNLKQTSHSFRLASEKGIPAVVSIQMLHATSFSSNPYVRPQSLAKRFQEGGFGSGVIVSSDGYILTNYHVIRRGEQIQVTLSDKREFIADLVGSDPDTDLAVLKINASNLPHIKLANSDLIRVGDWAIAVGNPFGLEGTVTTGIISAKGRSKSKIADYAALIQTDAAINPGNSGGALLNIDGELIGINTAIFSQTGGYMGIGFAIPSNLATKVLTELKKSGRVNRGWIGLYIQPITHELQEQFQLPSPTGALINDIVPDSPAEKAGLLRGDVILRFGPTPIRDSHSLRAAVGGTSLGDSIPIAIVRSGKQITVTASIQASPDDIERAKKPYLDHLGLNVETIQQSQEDLHTFRRPLGVRITEVLPRSSAYRSHLQPGNIILEINRQPIQNKKQYDSVLNHFRKAEKLILLVRSGKYTRYTIVKP